MPEDLKQFTAILVETCQQPMAMIPQTDDERRLLASSVNSTAVYRYVWVMCDVNGWSESLVTLATQLKHSYR